jgi:uncharacterized protein YhfF
MALLSHFPANVRWKALMWSKTEQTEKFWQAYVQHAGHVGVDYVVVAFGDNPDMATELAALVVNGIKRATASLVRDFSLPDNPLPKVGDFVVIIDGTGTPQCIYRTTEIEIKPLIAADERFAWDEGEGDRTLDYWLAAHRRYFGRQAAKIGFKMHDDIETVFERFEVV